MIQKKKKILIYAIKNEKSIIFVEDTLSRRTLCVLAGWRGCLHLLCVWKLCEETRLEILPALVLLPTVDEHFVLKDDKDNCDNVDMQKGRHIMA